MYYFIYEYIYIALEISKKLKLKQKDVHEAFKEKSKTNGVTGQGDISNIFLILFHSHFKFHAINVYNTF